LFDCHLKKENKMLEILLVIIVVLLSAICASLILLIIQLRKNNPDWSLVYPELAGMHDDDFSEEMSVRSVSGEMDKFLHEESAQIQQQSQKDISSGSIKLDYINNLEKENVSSGENVLSSVYAPNSVEKDEEFIVAAFLHLPAQREEVEKSAKLIDDDIVKRVEKFLKLKLNKGDEVTISLKIADAEIDDPVQSVIWNGQIESVEFGVTVNSEFNKKSILAKIELLVNSVPAGNLKFKLKVDTESSTVQHEIPKELETNSYQKAFISYASADRNEVLMRTQMLGAAGISYFQDIMNLKPGQLWENSLYTEIDKADVFFLFWSSAAKESDWVKKEYLYAKELFAKSKKPEIIPVPIEGPPAVVPPEDLSHLHFNDGFLYFINK
jgi:hypothetical protein